MVLNSLPTTWCIKPTSPIKLVFSSRSCLLGQLYDLFNHEFRSKLIPNVKIDFNLQINKININVKKLLFFQFQLLHRREETMGYKKGTVSKHFHQ